MVSGSQSDVDHTEDEADIQVESDVDMIDNDHYEASTTGTAIPFSTPEPPNLPALTKPLELMVSAVPVKSEVPSSISHFEPGTVIDLTGDSPVKSPVVDLTTPTKLATTASSDSSPITASRLFKVPRMAEETVRHNYSLSETEESSSEMSPGDRPIPPLHDMAAIVRLPFTFWRDRNDRIRLLISVVQKLEGSRRKRILDLITALDENEMWQQMNSVMTATVNSKSSARGIDANTFKTLTDVVRIFEIYVDCQHHKLTATITPSVVAKLERRKGLHWEGFVRLCHKINNGFEDDDSEETSDQRSAGNALM